MVWAMLQLHNLGTYNWYGVGNVVVLYVGTNSRYGGDHVAVFSINDLR